MEIRTYTIPEIRREMIEKLVAQKQTIVTRCKAACREEV